MLHLTITATSTLTTTGNVHASGVGTVFHYTYHVYCDLSPIRHLEVLKLTSKILEIRQPQQPSQVSNPNQHPKP